MAPRTPKPRAQTFQSVPALKSATMQAVHDEIATKLNRRRETEDERRIFAADLEHIRGYVGSARFWVSYFDTETSLRKDAVATLRLLSFLQKLPPPSTPGTRVEDGDLKKQSERPELHFPELVELAQHPVVGRLIEQLRYFERARNASKRSPRAVLADPLHLKGRKFWWDQGPEPRDRALISLLAGNFPSSARSGMTVEEVIELETAAIEKSLERRRHRTKS